MSDYNRFVANLVQGSIEELKITGRSTLTGPTLKDLIEGFKEDGTLSISQISVSVDLSFDDPCGVLSETSGEQCMLQRGHKGSHVV